MSNGSIIMVGWPDSGKSNYVGALWDSLRIGGGKIFAPVLPDEITYVEEILAYQSRGEFAPRSDKNMEESRKDFSVSVELKGGNEGVSKNIVVPDITGELWKSAVETLEISSEWMDELKSAVGAILFVRVRSKLNVTPLDWATTGRLLEHANLSKEDEEMVICLPTQIALCELLRFLEFSLSDLEVGARPRVAIVISAWDLLDKETAKKGPMAFLRGEYPLFAGRLEDVNRLEVSVFGMSSVGGDFSDPDFKERYLSGDTSRFVVFDGETNPCIEQDITIPIAWVIGGE